MTILSFLYNTPKKSEELYIFITEHEFLLFIAAFHNAKELLLEKLVQNIIHQKLLGKIQFLLPSCFFFPDISEFLTKINTVIFFLKTFNGKIKFCREP